MIVCAHGSVRGPWLTLRARSLLCNHMCMHPLWIKVRQNQTSTGPHTFRYRMKTESLWEPYGDRVRGGLGLGM